jgi:hypothetical protein
MTPKPLWLARLVGTQAEMGAQHGKLAAADAARLVGFYSTMPERALAGDGGTVVRRVIRGIANAWQARLVRDRPAELAARSRAFVEAVRTVLPDAGHPDHAMRTFATMDSMQNCVSVAARAGLGPFARPLTARAVAAAAPACSTAIAWGDATEDGELLFSRNFDFPGVGVWDAAPAFIVCAPDRGQRYGFFTTRGADTAVVTCVNEAGLVMAPHTRWHKGVRWGGAMIVDLVHEIARRAETLADAIAIARERPASSTWGIAIGSAREKAACVLEIAGSSLEVIRPDGNTLVCANRYRSPSLQAGQVAASAAWALHSDRRERRLRELIASRERPLTPRDVARFMGDRRDVAAPGSAGARSNAERCAEPIERHLGAILAQPTNVHCAVVRPADRRAWVGVDRAPCCEGTWAEIAWSWDGPAGAWEIGGSDGSGFTAEARTDFVAPQDAATRAVHDAVSVYEHAHDVTEARAAIERAIAVCPDDPSLRLPAAWLALEAKAPDRAMIHIHAGLARETETYRKGQLLLWGTRAAQAIDPPQSRRWLDDLSRLSGDDVDELQAAAKRKYRARLHVNLLMGDAY